MSQEIVVAKRYAKALFEIAKEQNKVAEIEAELQTAAKVWQSDVAFGKVVNHPSISFEDKEQLLAKVFGKSLSETTLNTLLLLLERGRQGVLSEVVKQFTIIASESLGQAQATVYSPVALSDKELKAISAEFSKLTGKTIQTQFVLNQELLGGIQVRIGDRLYDGSLVGKLERLYKTLNTSQAL